jgi:hypothetical protein
LTWEQRELKSSKGKVVYVLRIFLGGWLVYIALLLDCDQSHQRGLNSERGPSSFHPVFGSMRNIIAPKAYQMSLKWESFADKSFKFEKTGTTAFMKVGNALSMPVFYYSLQLNVSLYST